MARPSTSGAAVERTHTTHSVLEPRGGAGSPGRIAAASQSDGNVHARDGAPRIQCDGTELGSSGSQPKARMDSSGPGEDPKGDRGATQRHSDASHAWADRPASLVRIHLRRETREATQ